MTTMNIDLVYIWCDGSDPTYGKRLSGALSKTKNLDINAYTPARWRDNDELKYSLRSVEKFMPWIRRIFIITDAQTPAWLNTKNPRVKIVDHKDIIPKKYLPLYNSEAIELFIANIKDLSEHFIFTNDDMFAGQPLKPDFFFDEKGNPIVDVRKLRTRHDIYTDVGLARAFASQKKLGERSLMRMNRLAFDIFGRKFSLRTTHQMEAMRKSYLLENLAHPGVTALSETTRKSRFRGYISLQRIIFPLMDSASNRNTLRLDERPPLWRILLTPIWPRRSRTLVVSSRVPAGKVLTRKPKLFCINDDEYMGDAARANNYRLLQSLFPDKSEFEN